MTRQQSHHFEQARHYAYRRLERELPAGFYYHNLRHTVEDVVPAAEAFARGEGVQGEDLDLLLTAAWFHDLGFIEVRAGHEAVAARIVSEVLPGFGYRAAQVKTVQRIILATVLPQSPATLLEQIMADADLDVLGRENFLAFNNNLRRELAFFGQEVSDQQWFSGQLRFLEGHTYFTAAARRMRNAGQELSISLLKEILAALNEHPAVIDSLQAALARAETQTRRLNALTSVAQAVNSTLGPQEILEIAAGEIVSQLAARSCSVSLVDPARTRLEVVAYAGGEGEANPLGSVIPFADNPGARQALATRQPLVVAGAAESPLVSPAARQVFTAAGRTCLLLTPLVAREQGIGAFMVESGAAGRVFSSEEVELVGAIASQVSGVIENARLYEETRQRIKETEILSAANVALTQSLDLEAILATLLDYLQQVVPYDSGSVFVLEDEHYLVARTTRGYERWVDDPDKATGVRFDFRSLPHIRRVIEDQTTVVIPDVTQNPDWAVAETAGHVLNWLAVPLVAGGKTLGMYSLDKIEAGFFSAEHQRLAENLASQAAIAFQNAMLFRNQQVAREQAETLRAATLALGSTLSLQEVFELILSELRKVVPYDSCSVQQIDGNAMVIVGGYGFPNLAELLGARFDWSGPDDPAGEVVHRRQAVIIEDVSARFKHFRDETHGHGRVHGWMGVPLIFGERLTGMLTLDKLDESYYTQEHAQLAQAFATQAANAIENARLFNETQSLLEETRKAKETAETLRSASLAFTESLELDTILEKLLDYLALLIPYDSATIFLIEAGTHLAAKAVRGYERFFDISLARTLRIQRGSVPRIDRIIDEQTALIIPDTMRDVTWTWVPTTMHIRSWMGVPLVASGRPVGIYSLDKAEPGFFTEAHLRLAEALAAQAAIVIEKSQLYDSEVASHARAETQSRRLNSLNLVAQAVSSTRDLTEILEIAAREIVAQLSARSCGVTLINPERTHLDVVAFAGQEGEASTVGIIIPLEGNPGTQQVIATRESLVIPDIQNSPLQNEAARQVFKLMGTTCLMITPLIGRDEVIGTFGTQINEADRVFTSEEVELADTIASQISGALENARLFGETQRLLKLTEARAAELGAISRVSQALIVESELENTIQLIGSQMREIFKADIVYLALLDPQTNLIHFPYQVGENFTTLQPGEGLTGKIMETGEPLLINQDVDERAEAIGARPVGRQVLSYLGVPIKTSQGTIGVISVQSTTQEGLFNDDSLRLLSTIAANAGAALHNARMFSQALENLRQVEILTRAARTIENSSYEPALVEPVAARSDALGELARVFRKMADEVHLREQRLKRQLAQLQMDIEEKKLAKSETVSIYVPMDRRQSMANGIFLPEAVRGAALFADVSGFTALTESMTNELGLQRGAEEVIRHLNRVLTVLVDEVHRGGGAVISFSGDAITCWFDDLDLYGTPRLSPATERAAACALAMQQGMVQFAVITTPNGKTITLTIKVALAAGPARRMVLGRGTAHLIDVLAGATLAALSEAEHQAESGEIVLAAAGIPALEERFHVADWRTARRFAVLAGLQQAAIPSPWPELAPDAIPEAQLRPWMHAAVFERVRAGQSDMLSELRPATALFLKFGGLDYDHDPGASAKLDAFVQWVERVIAPRYGSIIQFTVGDKGSYIYIVFGAPVAHRDDALQAVFTALELAALPAALSTMPDLYIGLASGQMRVGAYGGSAHRTYGAIGDRTNLAARLMVAASLSGAEIPEGQRAVIFCNESIYTAAHAHVEFERMPPARLKGKSEAIAIYRPLRKLMELEIDPGLLLERASVIDSLLPAEQLTLKVASVIGHLFTLETLSAIYPEEHTREDLQAHLLVLVDSGLVQKRSPDSASYAFKDPQTHEAAYSLMLFAQRRQLHRVMAELLECTIFSIPPYAEIAYHWKAADEIPKAVQFLEKAGEHARAMGDFEEATRFFNESLSLNG